MNRASKPPPDAARDGAPDMPAPFMVARPSERTIIEAVRRSGGVSRSALTAHTELTQQSVHRLVDSLAERGVLRLADPIISGRGQPSPQIELRPAFAHGLGVSVNTDEIRVAYSDLACREIAHASVETDPTDRASAIGAIAETAAGLARRHGIARRSVIGAGIAMSGFRSGDGGKIVPPIPLESWGNRELAPEFIEALGLPVWIENNATAGAIGEAVGGAGLRYSIFAYLSINFGFGGGLIHEGRPLLGAFGNAGEVSTIYTPEQTPSRPALGELLKRLNARGIAVGSISELSARFDPDWPGVAEWIEEVRPQLDLIVRGLRAILDPAAIVFGGEAPRALREMLIEACDPVLVNRYGKTQPGPALICSDINGDPATYGGSILPLKACLLR